MKVAILWVVALCSLVWKKLTDISEVPVAFVIRAMSALIMEAASTSEMLVNFYHTTLHSNPEDSHPHSGVVRTPKFFRYIPFQN
jgi:hypothetical protein